jgi:hypothetical protein
MGDEVGVQAALLTSLKPRRQGRGRLHRPGGPEPFCAIVGHSMRSWAGWAKERQEQHVVGQSQREQREQSRFWCSPSRSCNAWRSSG